MDNMKELLIDRILEEDTRNNNTETNPESIGAKSKPSSVQRRGPYKYAHFSCDHPPNRLINCFNVTIGLKKKNTLVPCSEEVVANEKLEELCSDDKDSSRGDQTLPLDENTSIASEELVMDSSIVKMNTGDSSINNSSFNLSINSEDLRNFETKIAADSTDSDIDLDLDSSSTSVPVKVKVEEPKMEYRTDDILARYSHLAGNKSSTGDLKNANHEIFSNPGSSSNQAPAPRKVVGKSLKNVNDKTLEIQEDEVKKYKSVLKASMMDPVAPEPKKKPLYQCNKCDKSFTVKYSLTRHQQAQHSGKKLH